MSFKKLIYNRSFPHIMFILHGNAHRVRALFFYKKKAANEAALRQKIAVVYNF